MASSEWIRFEGYEGRLDPDYRGSYSGIGFVYPYIERDRTWDIVRVAAPPSNGVFRHADFAVLSRRHDMMKKAHEEAAAYRLHFKRCEGAGICQDVGHPGGPRRSARDGASLDGRETAAPDRERKEEPPSSVAGRLPEQPPVIADPVRAAATPAVGPPTDDWMAALHPTATVQMRLFGFALPVVPLVFSRWEGPPLTMSEDCNKRGGRVIGDQGEVSCAEVEFVKRLRAVGWNAAWVQSFKCGQRSWGPYIADLPDLPIAVRRVQAGAGSAGGHPDVLAWSGDRVVAIESKGPSDRLKESQIEWFRRAIANGVATSDVGVVQWVFST
jgi:hypothetical protein